MVVLYGLLRVPCRGILDSSRVIRVVISHILFLFILLFFSDRSQFLSINHSKIIYPLISSPLVVPCSRPNAFLIWTMPAGLNRYLPFLWCGWTNPVHPHFQRGLTKMPGLTGLFQSQWRDLEDGKDKPLRRGSSRRTYGHLSIRARRSTWQFAAIIALFILLFVYIRHHYETRATALNGQVTTLSDQITSLNHQITSLNDQLRLHELAIEEKRAKIKVTVLTSETREVSYWRESLGNKFRYARRHGYFTQIKLLTSSGMILFRLLNYHRSMTCPLSGPRFFTYNMRWITKIATGYFGWISTPCSVTCLPVSRIFLRKQKKTSINMGQASNGLTSN